MGDFRKDLEEVINRHSQENGCNTPDWILAEYLCNCLLAFDSAVNARERWYKDSPRASSRPGWRAPVQPTEMNWKPPPIGEMQTAIEASSDGRHG